MFLELCRRKLSAKSNDNNKNKLIDRRSYTMGFGRSAIAAEQTDRMLQYSRKPKGVY